MFTIRQLGRLAVPILAAMAFQTLLAGQTTTARSTSKSAAKPTASAVAPKSPVTISLTSTMRHGNLVVFLDGKPVFNEEFQKPVLLISQTTTWDPPLQVTAGKHTFAAKVYGTENRTFLSGDYDLEVSRTKGIELRIRVKGDKLTVEPAS